MTELFWSISSLSLGVMGLYTPFWNRLGMDNKRGYFPTAEIAVNPPKIAVIH